MLLCSDSSTCIDAYVQLESDLECATLVQAASPEACTGSCRDAVDNIVTSCAGQVGYKLVSS